MKNITITMDEKTASWLRVAAAQQGVSVARFIGDLLQERMREARDYAQSMRRFLDREPFRFEFEGGDRPSREELHDRNRLR